METKVKIRDIKAAAKAKGFTVTLANMRLNCNKAYNVKGEGYDFTLTETQLKERFALGVIFD